MSRDSLVRVDSLGTEVRIKVHVDLALSSERARESPQEGRQESPQDGRGPSPHRSARQGIFGAAGAPDDAAPITRVFGAPGPALRAGQILGGRYELERILGCGSMGAVWLARHRTLGERVALKVMAPAADADGVEDASTAAARFRFEAQVAARLSRKTRHVVRVTDHGQDGRVAFLVMEYLEGQTLEGLLVRRAPMAPLEVARLVTQIARGLEVAHAEGVLHRDLKPANVFLVETPGGPPLVKLLDFGLAHGDDQQRRGAPFATGRGVVFGTPAYMSPEQANASVDVDARSDLWSLAVIAYEALTGTLPVDGVAADEVLDHVRAGRMVPVHRRRPDLPAAYAGFFARAFARRAEDRYATCAELADAFERAGQPQRTLALPCATAGDRGAGPEARPGTRGGAEETARAPRRGGKAAWAVPAAVGLVVAVLGTAYALDRAPSTPGGTLAADDAPPAQGASAASPRHGPGGEGSGEGSGAEAIASMPGAPVRASAALPPSPAEPAPVGAANAALSIASSDSPATRSQGAPRPSAAQPSGDLGEFKSHF
jgi:serine/threonine-protein kinase